MPRSLSGTITPRGTVRGSVRPIGSLSGTISRATSANYDHYVGPYEVTPTETAQLLCTAGLLMDDDVTVAPIPSNYGLISWDGTSLKVS